MGKPLGEFGLAMPADRYLHGGEGFGGLARRLCRTHGSGGGHAGRMRRHIENLWFMPATSILRNGGADKGLGRHESGA